DSLSIATRRTGPMPVTDYVAAPAVLAGSFHPSSLLRRGLATHIDEPQKCADRGLRRDRHTCLIHTSRLVLVPLQYFGLRIVAKRGWRGADGSQDHVPNRWQDQ